MIHLKTHKKKLLILTLLFLFTFIIQINAETAKIEKNDNYIASGIVNDDSISVTNFSFAKRFSTDGKGNYLDFSFTIKNNLDFPIKMKIVSMGFWEKNEAEPKFSKKYEYRKYIQYPKWRKRDFEKEIRNIVHLDSIPKINKNEVYEWMKKNKPETLENYYGRVYNYKEKKWEFKKLGRYDYPYFLDFINYLNKNISKIGMDVYLMGMENNKFNATKDTPEGEHLKGNNIYTIIKDPLETTVVGRLYSRTRKRDRFFNYFGVMIYGVSTKDENNKDIEMKKVIFTKYIKFGRKFKIR